MDELTSRFGLTPAAADASALRHDGQFWTRLPLVVASLPFARQPVHHNQLCAIDYDLVIVDEAHMLKNRSSASWQLVNDLKKRFLLLLSATPVGNNLSELYNLILLLRPGLLRTEAQFRRGVRPSQCSDADDPAREITRPAARGDGSEHTRAHRSEVTPATGRHPDRAADTGRGGGPAQPGGHSPRPLRFGKLGRSLAVDDAADAGR